MRHSEIGLTMNVYTDPRLLDLAGAVDSLPTLDLDAEPLAATAAELQATGTEPVENAEKVQKNKEIAGFSQVGATGFEPATSASRTQRSTRLSHAPNE
jgi:hypothetical protein